MLRLIIEYREAFAAGLLVTVQLFGLVALAGMVVGFALGAAAAQRRALSFFSRSTSFILAALPVLVLLFWLHYPAQEMLHVNIKPFWTASLALSVVNVFGVADIVRESLVDFPRQYVLAAKVCGLSRGEILRRIQYPLILRRILPELLRLQVVMLQSTLFASLISVEELFRVAQRINAHEYRPIEIYSGLALFFLAVCLPLNGLATWLQRRYTRATSER